MLLPKVVLLGADVRRDGTFVLDFFKAIEFYIYYTSTPYNDHQPSELKHPRLHQFKWGSVGRDLKKLQPQLIVSGADALCLAHFPRFLATWFWARRLKIHWVPFVLENRPLEGRYRPLTLLLFKPLLRGMLRSAFRVLVGNSGAATSILALGVPEQRCERLFFSNWGVDLETFRPSASKKASEPTFLYVGRLVEEKGVLDFIDAVERAAAGLPGLTCRVWVVGTGPLEALISSRAQSLSDRGIQLQMMGTIANSELPRLFGTAWLTVAPSKTVRHWQEQVGVVNFQSLACGTPVLSTRSGAIPEYLPANGAGVVLVDESDVAALADVVARVWTDSGYRQELSLQARPFAASELDARKHVKLFETWIADILKPPESLR